MKKPLNRLVSVSLLSLLLILGAAQKIQAQDVEVSYQTFYDNLAPYGQWVYDPQYGNVWVPNEDGDFRPYGSRGHWVMTDYGNTWVSEDPWGWAVYHYGRWTYDPYYGWIWIPGYEWAPAWVSWRYGGGYSGWAPLGPGYVIGVSYYCPDSWWIFVEPTYMYRDDCFHHWRGAGYNTTYIHQTIIVNNYYQDNNTHVRYNYGPRRDVIERDTHQPVQVYRVSQGNRPGAPSTNGNRVTMYRPSVNRESVNTARPGNVVQAPRQISGPQPATNAGGNRQPQFRQDVQRQNGNNPQPGNRLPNNNQQPGERNPVNNNNQPGRVNNQQPGDRYQNNNNQPQPPARNNQQPGNRNQNNNQPQPPARNQYPGDRPQPQHFNNEPAPDRQPAPRPQPAPQPPRQQPAPAPRPQPAPQPQRQQPAPQSRPAPPREEPREQGGRR